MDTDIRGVVDVEVAGERRSVVCDMLAAEALYQQLGPHWYLWLVERFVGKQATQPDGSKIRKCEPLGPHDLMVALYGMLAQDRKMGKRTDESVDSLMAFISPFATPELQVALTRAVLGSLGVPGEVKGADASAAAEPLGSERAVTHGTGGQS